MFRTTIGKHTDTLCQHCKNNTAIMTHPIQDEPYLKWKSEDPGSLHDNVV
jgi:hypothetical protein